MNFFHMKESNRTCNHLKNSDFYRLDQFIVGSCEVVLKIECLQIANFVMKLLTKDKIIDIFCNLSIFNDYSDIVSHRPNHLQ
jgi:hypothetical protein